jgi:hypothetical protein
MVRGRALIAVGVITIGLTLGAEAVQADDPPPTISSFSANPSSLTIPGETLLMATATSSVRQAGEVMVIKNEDTGQTVRYCSGWNFDDSDGTKCGTYADAYWSDNANPHDLRYRAEIQQLDGTVVDSKELTVPVSAHEFNLSLSASPNPVTVPGEAIVTATADEDLRPSGASVAIVNDDTGHDVYVCNSYNLTNGGTTCGAYVDTDWSMNHSPSPMHFHAEVRMNGSEAPSNDPTTSLDVQRHTFNISLSADPQSFTIPGSSTIAATVDQSLYGTPYSVAIVNDATGNDLAVCSPNQMLQNATVCRAQVSAGWNDDFNPPAFPVHAELRGNGGDDPSNDPTTYVDARQYLFDVSLSFEPSGSNWIATAYAPLLESGAPFSIVIRDQDGYARAVCSYSDTCQATVGEGVYLATVEDASGNPLGESGSYELLAGEEPQSASMDGFNLDTLAKRFTDTQTLCNMIATIPEGTTHGQNTSTNDEYNTCEEAEVAGKNPRDALIDLAKLLAAAGSIAWLEYYTDPDRTGSPPVAGTAADMTPPPDVADPDWPVQQTAQALVEANPGLTQERADTAARACLWQAAMAGYSPKSECTSVPIFFSGDDVRPATDHDAAAISKHPIEWFKLNYLAEQNRAGSGWYSNSQTFFNSTPCGNGATGDAIEIDCDEYPYLSVAQGGPNADPAVDLAPVPRGPNRSQGSKLQAFYGTCELTDPDPFLVVTAPADSHLPTMGICNSG